MADLNPQTSLGIPGRQREDKIKRAGHGGHSILTSRESSCHPSSVICHRPMLSGILMRVSRLRLLFVLMPLILAGCVERLLEIRSDPPGAEVYIDGERKGMTPYTEKYIWYGVREVTLV